MRRRHLTFPKLRIRWARPRKLTEGGRGADTVIEAAGQPTTWQWAMQMVRKGGTVNLSAAVREGTEVKLDPWALHYSEITMKSTFHHTPQFMREASLRSCAAKFARAISSPERLRWRSCPACSST